MIRRVVDFALNNRLLVLGFALLLFAGGIVAFHDLPIEAYPDVADNYVEIITQWPGISAEQIEQQVTIPLEIVMNGIPHVVHLRSFSLFGLSDVKLIFDDESDNDWNRERVLERLSQVTLPPGVVPQMGTDWSPVGQIYFFTLHSTNPAYDPMELKSIEDWIIEKSFKAVPNIVDVASFGGPTREYQVRVDPNKLVAYGLSLAQVEQQLTNNNVNAGGSFIQEGLQQINVRSVGLVDRAQDIERTVIVTKNGTPLRVKDIAVVSQGPKIRLGQFARAIHHENGKIVDNDDVVSGIVLLRKGAAADAALQGIHEKVKELNNHILPPGVKIVPFIDRSDLGSLYQSHGAAQPHRRNDPGIDHPLPIPRQRPGRPHCCSDDSVFAVVCVDLFGPEAHSRQPSFSRRVGFRHGGRRRGGDGRKHRAPFRPRRTGSRTPREQISEASHEVQRPVFYRDRHHHYRLFAYLHTAACRGAAVSSHGLDRSVCAARGLAVLDCDRARAGKFRLSEGSARMAQSSHGLLDSDTTAPRFGGPFVIVCSRSAWACSGLLATLYLAFGGVIGSEFLPHLDEGALWVRGTLAPSTGPDEGIRVANQARIVLCSFPEVPQCTSQVGRPDDGTDTTGFFNTEYFVDLKPKEQWRPVFHENKDELIAAMNRELDKIPGVVWGFSQPIEDNMEEAVSGVKGELATKIYGDDLKLLEAKSDQIVSIMRGVKGIEDLGVFHVLGQPNLNVTVDRDQAARHQINVADVQDAIQTAVGGNALTQVLKGEARYDLTLRYLPHYRDTQEAIENIRLLSPSGERVSLAQLCKIEERDGGSEIYREGNQRYVAIKYSVRGRDLGGAVEESMKKVNDQVKLPPGYHIDWEGEYESQKRADERLLIVLPITVLVIFILLYTMFKSFKWALLILANVAMARFGGLLALIVTGTNFSVSSGVGFLALFGVSVQTGVIMLEYINQLRARRYSIEDAAVEGAVLRLRPIMMTMLVATLGLLPAALSHAIGSDSQRPFAIVIVGGLIADLVMSIFLLPTLYVWMAGERDVLPSADGQFEEGEHVD